MDIDEEKTMEKYAQERFNLNRKGVLKGKTTVEKILNWKSDLIKTSLHQFPDDLSNEAVQAFKNVTGFMAGAVIFHPFSFFQCHFGIF